MCEFVSRMFPPPPFGGVSVSEAALKHACDSVAVDSVIYPYTLWSSAPCGLALAYCRVTLLMLYKEKKKRKALVDGEGEGRGASQRNKKLKNLNLHKHNILPVFPQRLIRC